jgi:hypothetical protein
LCAQTFTHLSGHDRILERGNGSYSGGKWKDCFSFAQALSHWFSGGQPRQQREGRYIHARERIESLSRGGMAEMEHLQRGLIESFETEEVARGFRQKCQLTALFFYNKMNRRSQIE